MLYVFLFQIEHLFAAPNDQIRVTLRSDRTVQTTPLGTLPSVLIQPFKMGTYPQWTVRVQGDHRFGCDWLVIKQFEIE
jgi:hypothetical protein